MNKHFIGIIISVFFSIFCNMDVSAQSKQKWLKRNWNNMLARYNTYFHANQILQECVEDLQKIHKDDFNTFISVYPYGSDANLESNKPRMENVFKKTSVVIKKRPKSKWIDDSYFLIGKSHFFRGDFFSADETFQFVLSQYEDKPIKYQAKLWILKTYLQRGKVEDAESIFSLMEKEDKFPAKLLPELWAVAGEIFVKNQKYDKGIEYLKKALLHQKSRIIKYRIEFLLGQLYLHQNQYTSAKKYFNKVSSKNVPYEFAFFSNLGLIKATQDKNFSKAKRNLKRMLKDDKNIEYFDRIYFQLAEIEYSENNFSKSLLHYTMAANKAGKNNDLKTNAYLKMGKHYYSNKKFMVAKNYFDSAAIFINDKHPEFLKIKSQQNVLADLIDQIIKINREDSLQKLADMPKDKLDNLIKKIAENEAAEKLAKDKKQSKKQRQSESNDQSLPVVQNNQTTPTSSNFVFYNQELLSKDYNNFIKKWGNRPLTDNWRISTIKKSNNEIIEENNNNTNTDEPKTNEPKKGKPSEINLDKYYNNIPNTPSTRKQSENKELDALVLAALIYKDNLKEYNDAIIYFEKAIQKYPKNNREDEIYFHLLKCYEAIGKSDLSNNYKNKLINEYPKSKYNDVANTKPNTSSSSPVNSELESLYIKMYEAYQSNLIDNAIEIKKEADTKYPGNAISGKFELIYAFCVARTKGEMAYINQLKSIVLNYANTEYEAIAKQYLEVLENKSKSNKIDSKLYQFDGSVPHYFVLSFEKSKIDVLKAKLSDFNITYFSDKSLKIKSYLLSSNDILVVEIFENKSNANSYLKSFLEKADFFKDIEIVNQKAYIINEKNLKTMMSLMSESEYLEFFKLTY